ncbi:hypothetical protein [Tessaracoccus sp.]
MTAKATSEDVLAVINAKSVYDSSNPKDPGRAVFLLTKAGIVTLIAESLGYVYRYEKYQDPMVAIRKFVSVASVTNALTTLVEAGLIFTAKGSNPVFARHVHSTKATYYLSQEAWDITAARAAVRKSAVHEVAAGNFATKALVERHKAEWEQIKAGHLAVIAHLPVHSLNSTPAGVVAEEPHRK